MTSISSYGQFLRTQTEAQRLQSRQAELQTQASTGKKGTTLGELGVDALHSVNVRAVLQHVQTYKSNINTVELYASSVDTVMTRMSGIMDELRQAYATRNTDLAKDTTFLNELGQRGLKELAGLLNTQVEGRYIFAANDIHTPPVKDTDGLLARFQTEIDSYGAPTFAAGSTVVTNMSAAMEDPANYGTVYSETLEYAGNSLKARVDANRDVSYGLRADAPVFKDMMRALATAATVKLTDGTKAAFDEVLKSGADVTRDAISSLNTEQGRLGMVREEMKQLTVKHDQIATSFTEEVGKIEDVDIAEVASKLKLNDTALQSTYKIIGSMREFSLLNFLT